MMKEELNRYRWIPGELIVYISQSICEKLHVPLYEVIKTGYKTMQRSGTRPTLQLL